MKKLLLTVAIAATIVSASCSDTGRKSGDSTGDFKAKIENCTNQDSIKAYVNDAKAYIQKLVDEGKIDEAKKYITELEPVIKKKAPALAGTFEAAKKAVGKIDSDTSKAVDDAKEALSNAGDSIADAASTVKDAVADKAVDVKDAVVKKATDISDAAKDKVNNMMNNH